ncbi:MAG: four helix bundle protein [Armatimonadetes bacterium]|nr:four helix bundle protein [Armatimonadota bacterium]
MLELLVEASYTRDKAELLRRANLRLDRLRFLVRMAKDLKLISIKQYAFASEAIQAVGLEVGGWARSSRAQPQ